MTWLPGSSSIQEREQIMSTHEKNVKCSVKMWTYDRSNRGLVIACDKSCYYVVCTYYDMGGGTKTGRPWGVWYWEKLYHINPHWWGIGGCQNPLHPPHFMLNFIARFNIRIFLYQSTKWYEKVLCHNPQGCLSWRILGFTPANLGTKWMIWSI